MRVEQGIGRSDRIGQMHLTVTIHNFYYDGTVEAKVYRKLRDRNDAFTAVVGSLQPILAQVPTFIERAAMSADPEEEDVLLSQFERVLDAPPVRPALDKMVAMNIEADSVELGASFPSSPISLQEIERLLTTSVVLKSKGCIFEPTAKRIWLLTFEGSKYSVTFYPEIFDETPSLRLMNFGDPLFEKILRITGFQSTSPN